jgi:hypothetical protein
MFGIIGIFAATPFLLTALLELGRVERGSFYLLSITISPKGSSFLNKPESFCW